MLRFRRSTSFNAHDTHQQSNIGSGRVTVKNGVKRRCELVLNALLRNGSSRLGEVTSHLQKRFSSTYTTQDVNHALCKLREAGLVVTRGRCKGMQYRPSRDALMRWRALPKENI